MCVLAAPTGTAQATRTQTGTSYNCSNAFWHSCLQQGFVGRIHPNRFWLCLAFAAAVLLVVLRSPVPGYVAPFIYDNDLGSGWGWMPYKAKNTIVSGLPLIMLYGHVLLLAPAVLFQEAFGVNCLCKCPFDRVFDCCCRRSVLQARAARAAQPPA